MTGWYKGFYDWANKRPTWRQFVRDPLEFRDAPRESMPNGSGQQCLGEFRSVSYLRLLLTWFVGALMAAASLLCSAFSSEAAFVSFTLIAVVLPFAIVWATYKQRLRRIIPSRLGVCIGLGAAMVILAVLRPWNLQLPALLRSTGIEWKISVIFAGALVVAKYMCDQLKASLAGPTEWVYTLIEVIFFGCVWAAVGAAWAANI